MRAWILLPVAACSSSRPVESARVSPAPVAPDPVSILLENDADTAYATHDYAGCADLYARAAVHAQAPASMWRSAASCDALAGKPDAGFDALAHAVAAGAHDARTMSEDPDLASLRGDPRWQPVVASVAAAEDAYANTLKRPNLRASLLAMVVDDRRDRTMIRTARKRHASDVELKELDVNLMVHEQSRNSALTATIVGLGWPGRSLVGDDGAHAAWLIVQHAYQDLDSQKHALALMEPLVESGEVSPRDYAYLYDRIAMSEHRPQRWGTQYQDGHLYTVDDEAHVDERRAAIGLVPIAANTRRIEAAGDSDLAE